MKHLCVMCPIRLNEAHSTHFPCPKAFFNVKLPLDALLCSTDWRTRITTTLKVQFQSSSPPHSMARDSQLIGGTIGYRMWNARNASACSPGYRSPAGVPRIAVCVS